MESGHSSKGEIFKRLEDLRSKSILRVHPLDRLHAPRPEICRSFFSS